MLAVTAYGVAEDLGVLESPARATPARKPATSCRPKPTRAAVADVPRSYLRLYCKAGARYRIPWPVLAAIGKVESDHGRTRLPGVRSGSNWAGACGPMQIGCMPSSKAGNSWALRPRPPPRPRAAIPAAGRYLVDHGAHRHLDQAIYAYNHSWTYVAKVKQLAGRYAQGGVTAAELGRADRLPQRGRGEDRSGPGRLRAALLLDAYRITGRLPLEVQVQASRLRHAVKLVIQAEAASPYSGGASPAAQGGPGGGAAGLDRRPALDLPGPVGWVYLLCFRDPTTGAYLTPAGQRLRGQYAGHYWGWTDDLIRRLNQHRNPAGVEPAGWSRSPWPPG